MPKPPQSLPTNYPAFLDTLKERIHAARLRAALAVNRELVLLYWSIGRDILAKQAKEGWRSEVIDRLSKDLRSAFPGVRGFSRSNLFYMRAFAEAYPDETRVQQLAGLIPWFHNCVIIDKLKEPADREWYMRKAIEHGWSRNVLAIQIERRLHEREGRALSNFSRALPPPQSELAQALTKDEYNFDFLGLTGDVEERDIERGLVDNLKDFLLELGKGFAFIGSQYPLDVSGEEYRIDLLFYHVRLHCYVVIELKNTKFKPEYAGKLNFYLSAVDDLLRHPPDNPSIGMILCKTQDAMAVEYSLRDVYKPMGVAEFTTTSKLPKQLALELPTIEELEARLKKKKRLKKR